MVDNATSCHRFSADNANDNQLFMPPQGENWSYQRIVEEQGTEFSTLDSLSLPYGLYHVDGCPI